MSDGILAATVLEHSLESYQNILKQALPMCAHRTAQCVAGYVSTSGSSSHQTPSIGPVPLAGKENRRESARWQGQRQEQER